MVDGLKESQRKILYASFLKNLKYTGSTIKVAQLAGFVSEKTNYHHGEQCLYETITKMACDMVGGSNIPLFFRDGQFGSRLEGGKDAASARYIFTKLDRLTEFLFKRDDECVLENIVEEGEQIEPHFYAPIIPTILVNGISAGIGTGWSCNVPCFNPKDVAECVKTWITMNKNGQDAFVKDDDTVISHMEELVPWYKNFKGKIEKTGDNKFTTSGIFIDKGDEIVVEELPVGMWTDKFKDLVEDLVENKKIKSYKNYSTPYDVHFVLTKQKDESYDNIETLLKLRTNLSTNNIVVFNKEGRLQKMDNIHELIHEFCKVRLEMYAKRVDYLIKMYKKELKYSSAKLQFIRQVINKEILLFEQDEDVVIKKLEKEEYPKDEKNGYSYLLGMTVRSFTKQKLEELEKEITGLKKRIQELESTPVQDFWMKEIEEFLGEYDEWLKAGVEEKKDEEKKETKKKVNKKK